MSYPERIVPDESEPGIVALHLKRYAFAEPWCAGKEVLDVACGVGYGSAYLAETAKRVLAGDVDEASIEYARERYGRPNLGFRVFDAQRIPFDDASFDAVCSFETIEHLPDRDAYLGEVARVLRLDGTYLVSTPRADTTIDHPDNPFHFVEYSRDDFERLLRRYFGGVVLYGQRRPMTRRHRIARRIDVLGLRRRFRIVGRASVLTGSAPIADLAFDDIVIERGHLDEARELIAVCTEPLR